LDSGRFGVQNETGSGLQPDPANPGRKGGDLWWKSL